MVSCEFTTEIAPIWRHTDAAVDPVGLSGLVINDEECGEDLQERIWRELVGNFLLRRGRSVSRKGTAFEGCR